MIWNWKRPTAFFLAAAMIVTMSGVPASAVGPDGSAASGSAPAECSCETHCEQGHWLLHKKQFSGTGENAALRSGDESDNTLEVQANLLGSILLLPLPQVKRCFYQLRSGRTNQQLVTDMAGIQAGHAHSVGEP